MPKTYSDAYIEVRKKLHQAEIEAYGLEARLIVAHAAGKTLAELMRDMPLYISNEMGPRIEELVARRLAGEPVAYVTGSWEFYGLPLEITRDVLIPRMDTEVLVKVALAKCKSKKPNARILDLCSGSGCLTCALAHELPASRVVMVDISEEALALGRKNAQLTGVASRVIGMKADAREDPPALIGSFDLIVSNPPYIPTDEIATLDSSVKDYEPHLALDGGEDGLKFYRTIISKWKAVLREGGILAFEVGENQADEVKRLMLLAGFRSVDGAEDTAHIERVVWGIN